MLKFKTDFFDKEIWVYLGVMLFDILLRLVTLIFWKFDIQNFPEIPMFSKGIKFPEIVSLMLIMELIVMIGIFQIKNEKKHFKILTRICIIFGIVAFVLSLFYSSNVAGSVGIFMFIGVYLLRISQKYRLID